MRNERYYFSIMGVAEKNAYKCIYKALKERSYEINVKEMDDAGLLHSVYLKVLYDNPLFYYVNQRVIRITGCSYDFYLLPEYLYSSNEIEIINKKIKSTVDYICSKARNFENEFRMEKYLHDSIVKSIAYDYDALMKGDCYDAHSIVGALLNKKAVCEGIAKAFKLLCNEMGIKCIVVIGKADVDGDFSGDTYHAWNLVKISGESYYVDVTWDNTYEEHFMHISYDYFNVTTDEIMIDHAPEEQLPLCNFHRLNYFHCTKSFVNSYEELKLFIKERIKEDSIIFKVGAQSMDLNTIHSLKLNVSRALSEVFNENKGLIRPYTILFQERLLIGKIYFTHPQIV